MSKVVAVVIAIAGVLALGAVFFFIGAWVFKLLWNYVVPDVFGLATIRYPQALAIVALLHFVGWKLSYKNKD